MTREKGEPRALVFKLFVLIGAVFAVATFVRWLVGDLGVPEVIRHGVLTLVAFGIAGRIWYEDRKREQNTCSKGKSGYS